MRIKLLFALLACASLASAQDDDGTLTAARFEARGLGGVFGSTRAFPAYGGEVAYGLTDRLAVTGSYIYNRIASRSVSVCLSGECLDVGARAGIKELTAGLRLSIPLGGPLVAYGAMAAGRASVAAGASASKGNTSASVSVKDAYLALVPGGGLDINLTQHVGVGVDVRAIRLVGLGWYARICGTLYFRFP